MPELKHALTKIYYELTGAGEHPLVLLHGFCEDIHIWDLTRPFLEKDFKIIAIDFPGFGRSEVLKGSPSIESYAECVKAVLQQEGITKCKLAGHSLGGYAVLALAEKYPELLEGICLVHSQSFSDDEAKKEARLKAKKFVKEVSSERYVEELIANLFSPTFKERHPEIVKSTIEHNRTANPDGIVYALDAMRLRRDRNDVLHNFRKSVLYIISEKDGVIPYSRSLEMVHQSTIAEVVLMANSAHMGMIEDPQKTAKSIINWAKTFKN